MKTDKDLLEEVIARHNDGSLSDLKRSINNYLQSDSPKMVSGDWSKLNDIHENMTEYLSAGLMVGQAIPLKGLAPALQHAAKVVEEIDAKKKSFVEPLESLLVDSAENINSCSSPAQIKQAQQELRSVRALSRAMNNPSMYSSVSKLLVSYDTKLAHSISEAATYEQTVSSARHQFKEASNSLESTLSWSQLRKHRNNLRDLSSVSDDVLSKSQLDKVVKRYDAEHAARTKRLFSTIGKSLAGTVAAGALALGLYLGGSFVKSEISDLVAKSNEETQLALSQQEYAAQSKNELVEQEIVPIQPVMKTVSKPIQKELVAQPLHPPAIKEPEIFDYLSPVLSKNMTVLYIDRSKNQSMLLVNDGGKNTIFKTFSHTDSRAQRAKTADGQSGNPEGVYRLTNIVENPSFSQSSGNAFALINYPNDQEQSLGYTGDGIQLCGYDRGDQLKAIRQGRDVMNCGVGFALDDFQVIRKLYESDRNNFRVVIEDHKKRPLFK